jgi:hypothetical protein
MITTVSVSGSLDASLERGAIQRIPRVAKIRTIVAKARKKRKRERSTKEARSGFFMRFSFWDGLENDMLRRRIYDKNDKFRSKVSEKIYTNPKKSR